MSNEKNSIGEWYDIRNSQKRPLAESYFPKEREFNDDLVSHAMKRLKVTHAEQPQTCEDKAFDKNNGRVAVVSEKSSSEERIARCQRQGHSDSSRLTSVFPQRPSTENNSNSMNAILGRFHLERKQRMQQSLPQHPDHRMQSTLGTQIGTVEVIYGTTNEISMKQNLPRRNKVKLSTRSNLG